MIIPKLPRRSGPSSAFVFSYQFLLHSLTLVQMVPLLAWTIANSSSLPSNLSSTLSSSIHTSAKSFLKAASSHLWVSLPTTSPCHQPLNHLELLFLLCRHYLFPPTNYTSSTWVKAFIMHLHSATLSPKPVVTPSAPSISWWYLCYSTCLIVLSWLVHCIILTCSSPQPAQLLEGIIGIWSILYPVLNLVPTSW